MKAKLRYMSALGLTILFTDSLAATPVETCKHLFDEAQYEEALTPCLEAGESGHLDSQSILGELYERQGNAKETFYWWNRAANAGYIPARNQLAMKFYYGGYIFGPEEGWKQDYRKAYELWLEDAQKGHAPAQFMVAEMHHQGQGVSRDHTAAWAWFSLALEKGYMLAGDSLQELSKKMSPEQRMEAQGKLANYKRDIEQKRAQ